MAVKTTNKAATGVILILGCTMALWSSAAFLGALHQANWQISELVHQYMVATGMIKPIHTLVDFYSHIKGVEYIICVAFFVAFPVFVKYINKEAAPVHVTN